ncbi:hypothetical protein [Streptomyces sp. NPDC001635]
MADQESPRVLRLTFEFHVPVGLRVNIQGARMKAAAAAITSAVQALAGQVFPWANKMKVRTEWSYVWYDDQPEAIELPATDKNRPTAK